MTTLADRKVVLIVDDTPANIAIMSNALKDLYRTKVATNGEKALVLASADEKPDLIILDVMMPGLSGYEVCKRLKEDVATHGIPVIFLTGETDAEDERRGFDVGAVDYIHKPFSEALVLARVKTHLELRHALQLAREARDEADALLFSLLPRSAALEIKSLGTMIPRRYADVGVLFADVVNFTSYCDEHDAGDVISRLDALFTLFERVTAKHGLEKIKTIGDAFMAAAGLLEKVDDPLATTIRAGLEMASTLLDADLGWTVRVGVNVGPVIAGVVGQDRYQFDIWGDTVNVAARMAGKGAGGGVAVPEVLWNQISSQFDGVPLGVLEVKGKGTISVIEVRAEKAAL